MIVLGIETSCDETAVSVVVNDQEIRSNIVSSQWVHSRFGGVVPELAARAHLRLLVPVTKTALAAAEVTFPQIDLIAVTYAPGLLGAIFSGLSFAKSLALALRIPLIAVHHLEAHLFSLFLEYPAIEFPFIALIVSGGHTELLLVNNRCSYQTLGTTLDDACGEAFDKVAKLLGLPYPGGYPLQELARTGKPVIKFPKPTTGGFDFSFSGLKTAVLYYLRDAVEPRSADVASSFQEVATDALVDKISKATEAYGISRIGISGGVAANARLRQKLDSSKKRFGWTVYLPRTELCTDNAAMVAACGYERYQRFGPSPLSITAQARIPIP
jgi:N6-L-threonylcarbamoyladenine synthase